MSAISPVSRPARGLGGADLPDRPAEAQVGSLDMTNGHDRRALMKALRDDPDGRFSVLDKTMRDDFTRALKVAMRWALEKQDQRCVESCTRTMGMLEKMQQADQHLVFRTMVPEQVQHAHLHLVKVIKGVDPEAL